ncbi:MAG TPA: hypothetical protein VMW47_11855 [Verrucomicrobiae bacterium]|nr:hypothetical protein [Verrucomicrobiae bacterium]
MDDDVALEIQDLRRRVGRLKAEQAAPTLIAEYEAELRVLEALAQAAEVTLAAVLASPELGDGLRLRGFTSTRFADVYAFVYDRSLELELEGREFARVIAATDFAALLAPDLGD